MMVIRRPDDMRARAWACRAEGKRIVVVPTMGALHEGHLSLLKAGRGLGDVLVMTLFVNPTQFGPNEDLSRYPRDEKQDHEKALSCGVDILYAPDAEAVYQPGYMTYVQVDGLTSGLCGRSRPTHFRGVATIVTKLFHVTLPEFAVFGQKDYQQLAMIRRMTRDLEIGVNIVACPIVREPDGLAMSSRNQYLNASQRKSAVALSQGLFAAQEQFASGTRHSEELLAAVRTTVHREDSVRLEYVELVDVHELTPIEKVTDIAVLAAAIHVGSTRLIDNVVLSAASQVQLPAIP